MASQGNIGTSGGRRHRSRPRHRPFVPQRGTDTPNLEIILECFQDRYTFSEKDLEKIKRCLAELGMEDTETQQNGNGESFKMRALTERGQLINDYDDIAEIASSDEEDREPIPKLSFWRRIARNCSCIGPQQVDP